MKVLHIITGLNRGGAETALARLATGDVDNGHVVISLTDGGHYGSYLQEAGISVHTLNMPRGRVTFRGLRRLRDLLRDIDPHVIQTWMYHADLVGGVVAKTLRPKPIVWGIRTTGPDSTRNSFSARVAAWMCARGSRYVPTKIVSCSHEAVAAHGRLGYDLSKFVVVPNGYDFERLRPNPGARQEIRESLGIGENEIAIGMVGRWHPVKGHRFLLQALEGLQKDQAAPNWRCLLIGTDMDRQNSALRALLEHHGLVDRVELLGLRRDIPALMNALDVHVLASIGEGFPNVVAEAMACGTPCIVSDVGDAARIVGEHGWVVPPSDALKLQSALSSALEGYGDPEGWARRKAAGREWVVQRFSLDRMIQGYGDVWRMARHGVRAPPRPDPVLRPDPTSRRAKASGLHRRDRVP